MNNFDLAVLNLSKSDAVIRTGIRYTPQVVTDQGGGHVMMEVQFETLRDLISDRLITETESSNKHTLYKLTATGFDYIKKIDQSLAQQNEQFDRIMNENTMLRQEIDILKKQLSAYGAVTTMQEPTSKDLPIFTDGQNIIWKYLTAAKGHHVHVAFLAERCTARSNKNRELAIRTQIKLMRRILAKEMPTHRIVTRQSLGYALEQPTG